MSKFKIGNDTSVPLNIRLVPKSSESTVEYVAGLAPAGAVNDENGLTFTLAPKIDLLPRVRLGVAGAPGFINTDYAQNGDAYSLDVTSKAIVLKGSGLISPDDQNYSRKVGVFLKLTVDECNYLLQTSDGDDLISIYEEDVPVANFSIKDAIVNRRKYFDDDYVDIPLTPLNYNAKDFNTGTYDYQYKFNDLELAIPPVTNNVKLTVAVALESTNLSVELIEVPMVGSTHPYKHSYLPVNAAISTNVVTSSAPDIIVVHPETNTLEIVGVGQSTITATVTDVYGNRLTDSYDIVTYANTEPMLIKVNSAVNDAVSIKLTGKGISAYGYHNGFTTKTVDGDSVVVSLTAANAEPIRLYATGAIDQVDFAGVKGLTEVNTWGAINAKEYNFKQLAELTTLPTKLPTNLTQLNAFLQGCAKFNSAVNDWDVSKFASLNYVFDGCAIFDKAVDKWGTLNVTSMVGTFRNCAKFNKTLNNFTFDKVTTLESFLEGAAAFNQNMSPANVSAVTTFKNMFKGCAKLTASALKWNVESAINMDGMFNGATAYAENLNWLCVKGILTRPVDFGLSEAISPIWGTCPLDSDTTELLGVPATVQFGKSYPLSVKTNYDVLTKVWSIVPESAAIIDEDDNMTVVSITEGEQITVTCTVNTLRKANALTVVGATRNGISVNTNGGDLRTVRILSTSDIDIDWGDGTSVDKVSGEVSHTYTDDTARVMMVLPTESSIDSLTIEGGIQTVLDWGDYPINHIAFGTANATMITELTGVATPLPASLTSFNSLFRNCVKFNQSLSTVNLTNITDVDYMFAGAIAFNQSVNHFTLTEDILSLNGMFQGAVDYNQPMNKWDLQHVMLADNFLDGATGYKQDLSNWCVANITEEPTRFAEGSAMTAAQMPVWGTCPLSPEVDRTKAAPITQTIESSDTFTMNADGLIIAREPTPLEELKSQVDGNIAIREIVELTATPENDSEIVDIYGRWFIMVDDTLISTNDKSIDELKVELAKFGVIVEII